MDEKLLGEEYDNLNVYSYKEKRKKERVKSAVKLTDLEVAKREEVWNVLLDNKTDFNAYQIFRAASYNPKPNPNDIETNQAYIEILEAQRRFMQYKSPEYIPGTTLNHLDLTSAYATQLAGLDKSLRFFTTYSLDYLDKALVHPKYFNIVSLKAKMKYTPTIHLYAPNNRIVFKGKELTDQNMPKYGDMVVVSVKLLQGSSIGINGLDYFLKDMENEMIELKYISVVVRWYKYVQRESLYQYKTLNDILTSAKMITNKKEKMAVKSALVSFTGMLMNIDPSKRLIMLARCEEIIHRTRQYLLSCGAEIHGVQIDAIYYTASKEFEEDQEGFFKVVHQIIREVSGEYVSKYDVSNFVKIEKWDDSKYKETPFRLQEVR